MTAKVGADDHIASGGNVEDLLRDEPPRPHYSDTGNSERFLRQHGAEFRYVYDWHAFMQWTGERWERDRGAAARECAKETARAIYHEVAETPDPAARRLLVSWALKSESARAQQAMLTLAQSAMAMTPEQFDAHPWLFNTTNGTLDLETFELRTPRRRDYLTKMCPVSFDPRATSPRWRAFLEQIFDGDATLIAWLQKLLGTALAGELPGQILPIFWGGGANGKTSLLKALTKVLGEGYTQQAPMETFLTKQRGSIPNDVARLCGARLVVAAESGAGRHLEGARDIVGRLYP